MKVLQNERRLNIGCPFRRINGTTIRYKIGDITAFLESQPGGGGAAKPGNQPRRRTWPAAQIFDLTVPQRMDPHGVEARVRRMSVFKNGKFYHYEFFLDGRRHRGSTGTANKPQAIKEERRQRERLEKSYSQVIEEEAREQRRKTIQQAADEFLVEYKAKHESPTFAVYALGHVTDHLGKKLVVEITPTVVKRYQTDRLAEKAGPKTINDEVLLLLRLCGDQGDLIRAKLRREKAMKLALPPSPGRAYTADEKARMLAEAAKLRSKNMYPALVRGSELRTARQGTARTPVAADRPRPQEAAHGGQIEDRRGHGPGDPAERYGHDRP